MTLMTQRLVMDVSPWPNGRGFSGRDNWLEHVESRTEQEKIDHMMGLALIDQDVRQRLVKERDDSLLSAFGLSDATRNWLRLLKADSLDELAQAIVASR